jgi:adenylate cyclase
MPRWNCPACGGDNEAGTRFCGKCGAPREAPPGPVDQPDPQVATADALRSFVAGQVADRLIEAGGRFPEERRLITALFADISGFTGLADRLDPEQLLEVIDPVVSELSSVVGRYEGYVEKFAGDALLALFGAPVAHEDDPERALLAALEMHAQLENICRDLPPDQRNLTLHVGVNSGHGIARILGSEARMDYAVLGDAVILAQRLESAAPSGQTYVSETTYGLTRERFEFELVGELTLKGKAKPVRTWRLVGERTARHLYTRPQLVGRKQELELLMGSVDRLAAGQGAAVALTGEPGVGKSRLIAEARLAAVERRLRWLDARCISYGAGLAYRPYIELLRGHEDLRPDDPIFARLLGLEVDDHEIAGLDPEAFRQRLHEAFSSWLRRLVAERPTVLALEDLHWADPSSLALTGDLAAICEDAPLALLLIARPEAGDALAEIAPAAVRIELGALDQSAVALLLAEMLGDVPPRLAEAVHERTAGNPFFMRELVRSLQETGALEREGDAWRLRRDWTGEDVPSTIEGVLAARIDLLPQSAAETLQTASVIGRRVPVPLLERVATDVAQLDPALDRLVDAGFLDPLDGDGERRLAFHHALMQEVAYGRLLRRRRRDLHLRVAEEAEALYGAGDDIVELLARHLYLGEAGSKAVDYLVRAGERARHLYANEAAILHFERALELSGEDREIELALADVHELVGDYDDALNLYSSVREASNDVRAWRGAAATLRKQGHYEESLALIDRAFATDALRGADLAPLWLENAWTLSVLGRFEQTIDVVEAALAAVGTRGGSMVGHLLLQLARAEVVSGRTEAALEHDQEAQRIFEEEEDVRGLATSLRIAGNAYATLGRFDEAADALRRGLELAYRIGNAEETGGCLINLGLVELRRGAFDEAVDWNRQALAEFERIAHGSGRATALGNLAETLAAAGRYDEALEQCDRALAVAAEIGHPLTTADATRTLASIHLAQGRFREAAERAEASAELFAQMGATPDAVASLGVACEAWSRVGDEKRAREARSRARSLETSVGVLVKTLGA